jgi:hypothetical protein
MLLTLVLISAVYGAAEQTLCTWTYTGKDGTTVSYDMSGLKKTKDDYTGEDTYFRYRMNVCAKSNAGGECGSNSVCSYWKDDNTYHNSFGAFDGSPAPTWSLADPNNPRGGVQLTFTNGRSTCAGRTEKAVVQLKCDPAAAATPSTFYVTEDWSACVLYITMHNKISCPQPDSSSEAGGLSSGSLFLILLLVFVILYVGGGIFYNQKFKGITGVASCPNYDFWRTVPELTLAGCKFTAEKIKALASGNRSTNYEEFK